MSVQILSLYLIIIILFSDNFTNKMKKKRIVFSLPTELCILMIYLSDVSFKKSFISCCCYYLLTVNSKKNPNGASNPSPFRRPIIYPKPKIQN